MQNNVHKFNWDTSELEFLKRRLMRRVYFAWFLRKVVVPGFVVLPLGSYLLFTKISEQNVGVLIDNAVLRLSGFDLTGFFNYSVSAVRYTELDSLLIGLASFLIAGFFATRLLRDITCMMGRNPLGALYMPRWRR